jgi:CBS domain-containing membrane protein
MEIKELMRDDVLTVDEQMPVGQLLDLMTAAHVHSAPVVGVDGELIGIVSQEDILVGGLGSGGSDETADLIVSDIMTSPAMGVSTAVTPLDVARLMWRFHIHHVPVIDTENRVIGIVSSLDFCRVLAEHGPSVLEDSGGAAAGEDG